MLRTRFAKAAAVASLTLAAVAPALAGHHGSAAAHVSATTVWETAPVGLNTTVWE